MTDFNPDEGIRQAYRRGNLLRGGAVVVIANLFQKAVGVVSLAVVTRELGVEQFGRFAFAVAFGAFVQTLADLGLDVVTVRELAAAEPEAEGRLVGSALAAKALAMAGFLLIAACATLIFEADLRLIALIAAFTVVADLPSTLSLPLLARVRTIGPQVIQSMGVAVSALSLVVASLGGLSVACLVAIQVVVNIATGCFLAAHARRRRLARLEVDRATVALLVRSGLPLAASTFAVVVFVRIDQLMLGALGQVEGLARYAVSVRVVEALNVVPVALAAVVLPTLSHLQRHEPAKAMTLLTTAFRLQASVMLPLAALGSVGGGALLAGLFGEAYRGSGSVLAVLLWAHYFASSWVIARQALVVVGRTGTLVALAVVAAALNVGLNLWLIPAYGAAGAAWSTLVAYVAPILLGSGIANVAEPFRACLSASIRPGASAAVVLALLVALQPDPLVALMIFTVGAPSALLLTRSVSVPELRAMVVSFRSER